LWVDGYGNAETNIGPEDLAMAGGQPGGLIEVQVGGSVHELPWVLAYAEVAEGEGLLHADSAGLLAVAVRGGRADVVFNLSAGAGVTLSVG
jgi:S-adenosylmethionine hydrolase